MNSFSATQQVSRVIEELLADGTLTMEKNVPNAKLKVTGTRPNLNFYIFTGEPPKQDCFYQRRIIFNRLGFIPSFCQENCWKIVMNLNSGIQAHRLYEILDYFNIPGKAGYDPRTYTEGCWKGFAYNPDSETGLEARDFLRGIVPGEMNAVDSDPDNIVVESDIYLKRGCTEMEMQAPSDVWEFSQTGKDLEAALLTYVEPGCDDYIQSQWMINQCKMEWIRLAYSIADPTWKALTRKIYNIAESTPLALYQPSVQYEWDEDEDGEARDPVLSSEGAATPPRTNLDGVKLND